MRRLFYCSECCFVSVKLVISLNHSTFVSIAIFFSILLFKPKQMKLSHLSETLIGSEIVKLGGEIREKIRQGERIYNFTVGDFDPSFFLSPKNWKMRL